MDKIKYLHVMTQPSVFFNGNIIELLNSEIGVFNPEEHLFLVCFDDIYEKYKHYGNLILVKKLMSKNYDKFIYYSKKAEYIFLHQNWFYDFKRFICTPTKIKKKYIWCVWGHDLYIDYKICNGIKGFLAQSARKVGDFLINYEIKHYHGVGIGFKYDALEIKKRFKNKTNILMCPYPNGMRLDEIDSIIREANVYKEDKNKPVKIMVAHSAHEYLHHKEMLDKLSAYKDRNIIVSLPLVYGNNSYANYIEEFAKSLFGDKVEILRKRMDIYEYIKYLKSVDIAILDQVQQSGLGNLYYLLYLGKKVYLNKGGFLKLAFQLEGSYFDTTDLIGIEPYEQFIKSNNTMESAKLYAKYILNEKNLIDMWKSTLDCLK
ncbi:TDP-N-acetylfucosamine:lipid II N-acetylfucosaminyltransferase [Clostridium sp. SHJSY1]|uniref:TDP-N-acetylfucosamine:lipid II N-acetylfucosaminyltransferase n=1 Tax=Clostridium sp. SHJSY1 TaxID=2942483 RepID=UPI002875F79C|nr:TDP-N-acetylfucosamine:lipid II N-acetylfucosaminyltransferase [Clostridium sp. SHJSY1]MDS0526526.1 TDP-N-acetylfucosamine:lipid II N-acetylfucosaminyltransferase [Clostridium sp. SHJSY1]